MSVAPGTEGMKEKVWGRGRAVNLGASLRVSLTVMHTGFISVGVVCVCVWLPELCLEELADTIVKTFVLQKDLHN